MDDDELLIAADLNFVEFFRDAARRGGGAVLDEGGVTLTAGPTPFPVMANAALRTDPTVPAAEVVARADDFFGRHDRGYTLFAQDGRDADLAAAGEAAGLVPGLVDMPEMTLSARLEDAEPPPGTELRRVVDADGQRDYAEVSARAYAGYGFDPDAMRTALGRLDVLYAPHIWSVVGYVDDEPASAAMTMVSNGIAGIYWVGTTEAARGRGLGEACTRAVTNAGFDMGARAASLQASHMGEPIYRRMGYVSHYRYLGHVRFEPAKPARGAGA